VGDADPAALGVELVRADEIREQRVVLPATGEPRCADHLRAPVRGGLDPKAAFGGSARERLVPGAPRRVRRLVEAPEHRGALGASAPLELREAAAREELAVDVQRPTDRLAAT